MYKQSVKLFGRSCGVVRIEDNAFIPFDPANSDYQAYLKWLSEGNEPLPADEPQLPIVEPTQAVEATVVTEPSVEEALPVEEPNEG